MTEPRRLYVVIISEHNVAELQACLELQPDVVVTLTTKQMQRPGERFIRVLQEMMPALTIHALPGIEDQPLEGTEAEATGTWLGQALRPFLEQHSAPQWKRILNFTGGTKLLSVQCLLTISWDELHYQHFGHNHIQVLTLQQNQLREKGRINLEKALNPLHHARLYLDHVKPHSQPALWKSPQALPLAEAIHGWVSAPDLGLGPAWLRLCELIEKNRLWDSRNALPPQVRLTWQELGHPAEDMRPLIERLNTLEPAKPHLHLSEEGLYLPGAADKASKNWRRFIAGEWFELLVLRWLEQRIERGKILSNVQLHANPTESGREVDILFLHNNTLSLLELKVSTPPGHSLGDAENQLSSLAGRVGKTRKVLVVSPLFRRPHTNERWLGFVNRCLASQVTLIVLNAPKDLDACVNAKKPSVEIKGQGLTQ